MKKRTIANLLLRPLSLTLCAALMLPLAACDTSSGPDTPSEAVSDAPPVPSQTVQTVPNSVDATGPNLDHLAASGMFYTDYVTLADQQQAAKELSIEIAEEGDVLLKNENNVLPLSSDVRYVTLFGMHSISLIPSGGGSAGGTLGNNGIEPSTVRGALENAGYKVNPKTLSLYETHKALGTTGNELPVSYYDNAVVGTYGGYGDAAVVTLSRLGAENADLLTNNVADHADEDEHALQLDDNERDLIRHVKQHFDKVIVLINASNIMQIPDLAEPKTADNLGVDAILWVGNTGNNAIEAVGSILNGTVNPSGHTVDIWARDFTKDPTFTNFSANTQNKEADGTRMDSFLYYEGEDTGYRTVEYREGIYMGYRYYETMADDMNAASEGSGSKWYEENVLYPFGYGLSYTSFDWALADSTPEKGEITAANQVLSMDVTVTNTGSVAGKDVVQVYATPPYTSGGIEKASANLMGFAKTKLLQPGESETVTVTFVAQDMASFDYNDANSNGFEGYELEAGDYVITARRDSHDVAASVSRTLKEGIQCKTDYTTGAEIVPVFVDDYASTNASLLDNQISRTDLKQPAPASKEDRTISKDVKDRLDSQETYASYQDDGTEPWYVGQAIPGWTQAEGHAEDFSDVAVKLRDMSGIPYTQPTISDGVVNLASDENSKKWDEFMNQLTWDELVSLIVVGGGSTGIESIGKSEERAQDGSCQIKDGTLWASTPILSATYNVDLAKAQGRMIGNESIFNGISGWYGPSMDIHRSPFSGRNFEYYSQDGVQGGIMAAALMEGVSSKGVICFTKHCFLNDQEAYRGDQGGVLTMANEQAIREIYAKCFERAVKAGSMGIMSAFNRIGYVPCAYNYAMKQSLLRDEWGFSGYSCTDAWIRAWCPLDLMVRAGDEEVLGTGANAPEYDLEKGTWDPNKNCVLVKASSDAASDTLASYTHYYAVRRAAQRILYTCANTNANKNGILAGGGTDVYLEMGVDNNASITMAGIGDLAVELAEDAVLPDGLELNNIVISGTPVVEGDYTVPIKIRADGWVNSTANLNIHVGNAMHYNGSSITGDVIDTIKAGQSYTGTFDCPFYAYQNLFTMGTGFGSTKRVLNWYIDSIGRAVVANEDKTAADITTIDPAEAAESHVYGFSVEGSVPDGLTFQPVTAAYTGTSGAGEYQAVSGYQLSGTPTTPGSYTFTVTLSAPWVTHHNVWDQPNWGHDVLTYSRTVTLVVE